MRVLSIDLDYIFPSQPNNYGFDDECDEFFDLLDLVEESDTITHPVERWKNINKKSNYRYQDFVYDADKLKYLKYLYLTSLPQCNDVGFGYEHDNIMYKLKDCHDIELINVDTHDDVVNTDGGPARKESNYSCDEGNWIELLWRENRLKSLQHICGNISKSKQSYLKTVLDCDYEVTDKKPLLCNPKFDYIFVCLSPYNLPPQFWNIFEKVIHTYEQFYDQKYDRSALLKKFEIDYRYEFLHQCSNDREQVSVPWL